MSFYLGIDLGTSSVKSMIVNTDGGVLSLARRGIDIDIPMSGYAEQFPDTWWKATVDSVREAFANSGLSPQQISGIGLSGQMHGMVLLGDDLEALGPSIIWCDQRSRSEVRDIQEVMGDDFWKLTLNPLSTGFQLASLLWIKRHETALYERTKYVISPKDYIRLKLIGEVGTDHTDASATLAYETSNLCWCDRILDKIGIDKSKFPPIHYSHEIAGTLCRSAAEETGLIPTIPVVYGGSDQSMQAVGNGIIHPGLMSVTIGTGGQIFTPVTTPVFDPQLRTHTFCSAIPGTWNVMGAILSAGLSLKWWERNVLHTTNFKKLDMQAGSLPAGSDGLFFFPYLMGERTPHMDSKARGSFWGLTLEHTDAHMTRAVMEGVAFAMRECMEIFTQMGLPSNEIVASGGGACSSLWIQILADILDHEIQVSMVEEQACLGAAMVAAVGTKAYKSFDEACARSIRRSDTLVKPDPRSTEKYARSYGIFKQWYGANKELFNQI